MNVTFWTSNKDFDKRISELFKKGVTNDKKDTFSIMDRKNYSRPLNRTDVAVFIGVKSNSKDILKQHLEKGKNTIFIDKGYIRIRSSDPMVSVEYYRFSVNGFQPLHYFQQVPRSDDRWKRFKIDLQPMQRDGEHIVFAGSSAKYSRFFKLPDPTDYAQRVFKMIKRNSLREIIYRPKPSWRNAVPIRDTLYSSYRRKLHQELIGAHALVTHGSNACLDAMIRGIPTFVLGGGITTPLSKTDATEISFPYYPTDDERYQLCCDAAYCQWNLKEMATGEAWRYLRQTILEMGE